MSRAGKKIRAATVFADLNLEMEGAPAETFTQEGIEAAAVVVRVPWTTRLDTVKILLGGVTPSGVVLPVLYSTEHPHVYITEVAVDGPYGQTQESATAGIHEPEYAKLRVKFELVDWRLYENTGYGQRLIISEDLEASAEFIQVPPKGLYWTKNVGPPVTFSDPLSEDEAPGLRMKFGTWTVTVHFVPGEGEYDPISDVFGMVGYSNGQSHYSPKYDKEFAAGTLLCGNPVTARTVNAYGLNQWTVEFPLAVNEQGWNKFRRAGQLQPQYIYMEEVGLADYLWLPYTGSGSTWAGWIPIPT